MTTRLRTLAALLPIAVLVAACGSSAATPTSSPADTVAGASASPVDTATATAVPTDTATAFATALASPTGPAATPAPRAAWVHGQTVKFYDLVKPGKGWVYTNRGVWQTIDDGATWANATPPRLIVSKIRGLGALDADHALLAVVDVVPGTSTYYIWRTTNAGLTWVYTALPGIPNEVPASPCAPGDFCGGPGDPTATFDYVDANTAFVYIDMRTGFDGLNTYLYETTDAGATWTPRTYEPPDPPTASGSAYRVQFMTPNIGVAEFEDQISSTITGWGHWTHRHLPTTDFAEPRIDFLSETKWYGDLGIGYDPGSVIYKYTISTDQGRFWTNYTSSVPGIANLYDAHVQFLGPLEWIGTELTATTSAVGPSQTIYTTDGGHHWALEGAQPFNASRAFFVDATHGWTGPNDYTGTGSPGLYSTSDGGRTWRLLTP
jgi:photosystem II stability/assembly factor-like uncharacterized protein